MTDSFDPYHKWLGIPPHEQPATYYRLLGVNRDEADPDVIESAADQRMAHLRSFQSGKRAAHSQKLLNEVAAAKACLLHAEKRAAYDAHLAAGEQGEEIPAELTALAESFTPAGPRTSKSVPRGAGGKRKSATSVPWPAIAGGGLAVVVLSLVLIGVLGSHGGSESADGDAPRSSDANMPQVASRVSVPSSSEQPDGRPPESTEESAPAPAAPNEDSPEGAAVPPVSGYPEAGGDPQPVSEETPDSARQPDSAQQDSTETSPAPSADASESDSPESETAGRTVPPSDEVQRETWQQISQVVKFDESGTGQQRREVVADLLSRAAHPDASSAEVFVLLRFAVRIAAEIPDPISALAIADDLVRQYEIDGDAAKSALLRQMAERVRTEEEFGHLLEAAGSVLDDLEARHEYEAALEIVGRLHRATIGSIAGRGYRVELTARQATLQEARQRVAHFQQALQTLEEHPDDPAANQAVGAWYCFLHRDWHQGLPHLAKGTDAALAQLAVKELQASGDHGESLGVEGRFELAEGWWRAAGENSEFREPLMLRAGLWYLRARPGIESAVVQAEVDARLAAIRRIGPVHDPTVEYHDYDRNRKVLLITQMQAERNRAQQVLERLSIPYEAGRFDLNHSDYSRYHTIIVGSNDMDYWSGERKQPEAFQHLDRFIEEGGHLFVFGTFNCRNLEHLRKYGIHTGFTHITTFARSGRPTDLFLEDVESLVPEDFRTRSFGHFNVRAPHTKLLQRSQSDGRPVVATIPSGRGRVTFSTVEPSQTNGLWLIDAAITWIHRGSPVPAAEE